MDKELQDLPPELAAKIALAKERQFQKLLSPVSSGSLYFMSVIMMVLVCSMIYAPTSPLAKNLVINSVIVLCSSIIGYLGLLNDRLKSIVEYIQSQRDQ